jgi:tellurite resistance protein
MANGRGRMTAAGRAAIAAGLVMAGWLGAPAQAEGSNDALLRLLQVLRDRGSISASEYEEIRLVAEAGEARGPVSAPVPAAVVPKPAVPPQPMAAT